MDFLKQFFIENDKQSLNALGKFLRASGDRRELQCSNLAA